MRRLWSLAIVIALFILLVVVLWAPRIVPNPPVNASETLEVVTAPPASIKRTLQRACYNCHSNQTEWPWYAHLRPIASRIRNDVRDGRRALNFSQWQSQTNGDPRLQKKTLETSCVLMQAGMMPPPYYRYIHPGTKLTHAEIREFCAWARSPHEKMMRP
jgi:hypothetical protein